MIVTHPWVSNRLEKCCADDRDFSLIGKWFLHASAFNFDGIIIKVANNQDRHKSLGKFDFGPLVSMVSMAQGVLDDIYFQSIRDIWKKKVLTKYA